MTTCEYIDSVLESRNMSRRKLALEAGIAPSSFQSAMERNTTLSLDMLVPISNVLDMSIELLTSGGEGDEYQYSVKKSMFYDIFENLCAEKKVTPAAVRAELGIGQSTMATWKSKALTPKYDTLKKLSEYFGVSIDYLLGKSNSAQPQDYAAKCADNPVYARIDKALAKLSYTGQQEAAKRVEELTEIPRYQRSDDKL